VTTVEGTVTGVIGPPGRQYVRVRVELGGPDDEDAMEEIALPADLVESKSPAA
jgi:hypothetical protein